MARDATEARLRVSQEETAGQDDQIADHVPTQGDDDAQDDSEEATYRPRGGRCSFLPDDGTDLYELFRGLCSQDDEELRETWTTADPQLVRKMCICIKIEGDAHDTEVEHQKQRTGTAELRVVEAEDRAARAEEEAKQSIRQRRELRGEVEELKATILSLKASQTTAGVTTQNQLPRAGHSTPFSARPSPALGEKLSEKMPDPDIFKGGDHTEWRHFKDKMEIKLTLNNDRFPTLDYQMGYLKSRLAGTPLTIVLDAQKNTPELTPQEGLAELANRYEDHFAELTARDRYQEVYQKGRSFDEFWGDFSNYAIAAGIDKRAQLLDIRQRLSSELYTALVNYNTNSLQEFVDQARMTDRNLRKRLIRTRPRGEAPTRVSPSPAARVTGTVERPVRETSNVTCFKCGKKGHYARTCPEPSDTKPSGNANPADKS
jgi:Zinc knuckle